MENAVKNQQKQWILKGSIFKVMFDLSWPAVLAMVLYGLNSVFDALFVGRFVGETALAGVSLAYPLSQVTLGIGSLIGVGAGSVLSIAIGANDVEIQKKVMGNVNVLTIVSTMIYVILGGSLATSFIRWMGGSGDALGLGATYFKITVWGSALWIYGLACNMIVRAEGKMKSAAWMMAVGLGVNIVANYVLIVKMHMGVAGAAWGTNLGMLVYSVVGFLYFKSGKATFLAKPTKLQVDQKGIRSIISLGMPSFIMSVMSLLQAFVVLNAISRYGTTMDVAFYGVVYRLFTLMLTPIFGLMRALQPVIGINYGAREYKRVISSFNIFNISSTVLLLPFWMMFMIYPEGVLKTMLPGTCLSIENIAYFRVFMSIIPLLPVIFMSMTYFPATDNGKPAAILGIARQLLLYVPVMLILPRFMGVSGVYYGSVVIDLFIIGMVYMLLRKEFRVLNKASEDVKNERLVG